MEVHQLGESSLFKKLPVVGIVVPHHGHCREIFKAFDENPRTTGATGEHGAGQGGEAMFFGPFLHCIEDGSGNLEIVNGIKKIEEGVACSVELVVAIVLTDKKTANNLLPPADQEELPRRMEKEGMFFPQEDAHLQVKGGNVKGGILVKLFRKLNKRPLQASFFSYLN